MDLSRMRAGAVVPTKTPAAIEELIEGVLARSGQLLEQHDVHLQLREDLPEIALDVVLIDQALTNIVENAARFTPPGRRITIGAARWRDGVQVRIADHGPGIPREERDRVFEPFVRGEEHGDRPRPGHRSSDRRGAWRFDPDRRGTGRRDGRGARAPGRFDVREGRVLVVDDDPQILRAVRTSLQGHDYEVLTAGNGETALDLLPDADADLVVLDLGLPGIGGHEVIRRLRSWSDVPIIVLSVREGQHDKVEAFEAGADDYVTKPFAMPELLARMRAVRRRVEGERRPPVVRFDDPEVDLGSW